MSMRKWIVLGLVLNLAGSLSSLSALTETGPENHGLGPVTMDPQDPPDRCACEEGPVTAVGTAQPTCAGVPLGDPLSEPGSADHTAGEVESVPVTVVISWTCSHGKTFTQSGTTTFNFTDTEEACGGDCASGSCPNDAGGGSGGLKCINLKMNLGKSGPGRSAGYFRLLTNYPSALLSSPQSLTLFHPAANVEIITDNVATGVLRQVLAPECLANIVTNGMFQYTIEFYFPQDISGENPESGYYEVAEGVAPFATWTLENPAQSITNVNTLKVTAVKGGATTIYEYEFSQPGGAAQWSLATGNGLKRETLRVESNGTDTIETRAVENNAGVLASKVRKTYRNYDWGSRRLVKSEVDPDGANLTTSQTYYNDPAQTGKYGRIASKVEPDGRWTRYDYDQQGRLSKKVESWLDAGANAPENEAQVTEFGYEPIYYLLTNTVVTNGLTNSIVITNYVDTLIVRPDKPRSTSVKILGQVVTRTFNVYYDNILGQRVELEEICAEPNAGFGAPGNQRAEKIINLKEENSPGSERSASIKYPDGRQDTYSYEFGVYTINANPELCAFTPNSTGNYVRVTVVHGTSDHPGGLARKSTKNVVIEDHVGRALLEETYVYIGSGFERIAWTLLSRDEFGRELARESSDGARTDTSWACCGKESEKDAAGIERTFSYDALKRLEFTSKVGTPAGTYPAQADINTTWTYDAADRQLSEVVSSSGLSMGRTNEYDLVGRLTNSTDFAGLATATAYSQDGLTITETLPGGFTRITERFKDGQTKSITGTAAPAQYYEYGINADGTRWTKVTTGIVGGPVWQKTTTDLFGRLAKVEKPGYSTTEVTENFYNNKGQLVRQSTVNSPQSLFEYDELGNQIRSGLDVNANGVLDLAGLDRITESERFYNLVSGIWYLESVSRIYATDNSATPLTNSVTRQRLAGLPVAGVGDPGMIAETITIDAYGNQTVSQTTIDRSNKLVTQTVDVPDSSSNVVTVAVNGLVQSQTSKSGITTTYTYDSLNRRTRSETSGGTRSVASVFHYDSHGWVDYTEDAAGHRTTFTYDLATGRKLSQTDPLTNSSYFSYSSQGQLEKTWGSASYPVLYEYDSYGRMTKMNTYRDGSGWSGPAWPANPGAAGKSVTYTYHPGGHLATRTWSRLVGAVPPNGDPLVTSYSYSDSSDLTAIDYSDGTPNVSFTSDRLGRQKTAASSVSAHTFAYNGLLLDSETIASSAGTNIIDRSYDSLGRSSGFTVAGVADPGYSVAYGYDSFGRLNQISNFQFQASYSYLPNSDLISSLTSDLGPLTSVSTRSYEPHRNLLTQLKNQVDSETISQFDYANDAGGRRTSVKHSGTAFETGAAFNLYDYNSRSEVIVGDKFWGANLNDTGDPVLGQGFAYAYDNIGNRTAASRDNEETSYTANNLNQYSQRTVADLIDIIGYAETNTTVTVNDLPTTRHEKYWYCGLGVTNDTSAVYQEVTVVGVYTPPGTNEPDIVSSETGHVFVAKNPEQFIYDDDGNMLSDGRFNYSWDNENRLIGAETLSTLPSSVPRVKLEFSYDYMSRRVEKAVFEWDNNKWQPAEWRAFVWDGWNMVAEKTIAYSDKAKIKKGKKKQGQVFDKNATTSTSYYVWGLDLSGTLQGAGGVGGLLAASTHFSDGGTTSVSSVFYTFDANGNVSELLDADNGTNVRAHYEYSPFGETLVSVGDLAKENTFRFSTKYFDQESGLYYYGYRYYSPSLGRWLSRDPIGERAFFVTLMNSQSLLEPSRNSDMQGGKVNINIFVLNNPIRKVDFLGLWCIPFTTKKENERYDPEKNAVPWNFNYVEFTDLVQGDGYGSGVGVYLSYTCHYKRTLTKKYDKYKCNLCFTWKYVGPGTNTEPDQKSVKHSVSGSDSIVNDAWSYRNYAGLCQKDTPSP